MPLSEFTNLHKPEPKATSSSADLSSFPENIVELVWENGQIVLQGQSSRAKTSPPSDNLSSQMSMIRDNYKENSSSPRSGKFSSKDSALKEMPLSVPPDEMDLGQNDETVPWLNCSQNNSLQQDYSSELAPEVTGLAANNFAVMDKTGSSNQMAMTSTQINESKVNSSTIGPFSSWSYEKAPHPSVRSLGSGVSHIIISNSSNNPDSVLLDSVPGEASGSIRMQKPETSVAGSGPSLLNFSHFSRSLSLGRANLENTGGIQSKENKEKLMNVNCLNPANSAPAETCSTSKKEMDLSNQPDITYAKASNELFPLEEPNIDPVTTRGAPGGGKAVEARVTCSSVCSGNSPDRTSNDQSNSSKRKYCDDQESGCQSEDTEDESISLNTTGPDPVATGPKRSRAAEVHNLSERRPRDKINEKMQALQELIPNCNKADKASMLDEAIEYLRTLQHQVQIMSMGAGFCVPQMMYPAGMHAAQMQHLPLIGLGMGMRMGMGMGLGMRMQAMNGGSPVCPSFPIPLMQQLQLSSPPFSEPNTSPRFAASNFPSFGQPPSYGPSTFQETPASNFPIFGHPGLCHPIATPKPPTIHSSRSPATNAALGLSESRMGTHVEITMNPENVVKTGNSQPNRSLNRTSSQIHAKTDDLCHPSLAQKGDQLPHDSDNLRSLIDVPGSKAGWI